MHAVVQDAGVERRVKLDAGHLPAEELAPGTNAVDMVMFDGAERSAHMADDRVLPAIMNHVVAHDMRADESLLPSDTQPLEHRFELVLVTGLALGPIPFVVACFLAGARLMPEHLTSWTRLRSIIHPVAQFGPMAPT